MGSKLDEDLRALLQYYGEDPRTAKPENLFCTIVAFSSALLVGVLFSLPRSAQPGSSSCTAAERRARGRRRRQEGATAAVVARHHHARITVEREEAVFAREPSCALVEATRDTNATLPPPPRQPRLASSSSLSDGRGTLGRTSIGRGGFDDAIRDLRSGVGTRRQRSSMGRPLSRIFLDGAAR